MSLVVMKFGGTSVADLSKIANAAKKVKQEVDNGHNVIVIVSAMSGKTNELVGWVSGTSKFYDAREYDAVVSSGENVTAGLMALTLDELGVAARSWQGWQVPLLTNTAHGAARILDIPCENINAKFEEGMNVAVVAGFQGVSPEGRITTLGRGGSDTSAVALAAALDAERCEIYSDVDGVYSADPAVVADARHLPEISYPEMQEMSTAGAKVLNASAVQFAKEKNIALYARSTFQPGRETVIRKMSPGKIIGVRAVVREEKIERVRISGQDVRQRFQQVISYLENEQVPVKEINVTHVAQHGDLSRASFVVPAGQLYDWKDIKAGLKKKFGPGLAFDTNLAAVALIGEGLNRNNQTLLSTLELLAENNIIIHGVTTTSFRISLLVPREHVDQSVRVCHERWITSKIKRVRGAEGSRGQVIGK